MTAPPPRRPWYRCKRTWAAAAAWLAAAYPLSLGPVGYAKGRGWFPAGTRLYRPLWAALEPFPDATRSLADYFIRGIELGETHDVPDGPALGHTERRR